MLTIDPKFNHTNHTLRILDHNEPGYLTFGMLDEADKERIKQANITIGVPDNTPGIISRVKKAVKENKGYFIPFTSTPNVDPDALYRTLVITCGTIVYKQKTGIWIGRRDETV